MTNEKDAKLAFSRWAEKRRSNPQPIALSEGFLAGYDEAVKAERERCSKVVRSLKNDLHTEEWMNALSAADQAILFDDQETACVEVVVGSKWNYDRSLDHAIWKRPLVVKEIVDGISEKAVIFDQPMPYKSYGISYFGIGFDFPFTPYKESDRG